MSKMAACPVSRMFLIFMGMMMPMALYACPRLLAFMLGTRKMTG